MADRSVRWDLLADAVKGPLVWKAIARQMGPQALRMNLNTLLRHEVVRNTKRTVGKTIAEAIGIGRSKDGMVDYVAERLADPEAIRRSRQFPNQFLAAYLNASVPSKNRCGRFDLESVRATGKVRRWWNGLLDPVA